MFAVFYNFPIEIVFLQSKKCSLQQFICIEYRRIIEHKKENIFSVVFQKKTVVNSIQMFGKLPQIDGNCRKLPDTARNYRNMVGLFLAHHLQNIPSGRIWSVWRRVLGSGRVGKRQLSGETRVVTGRSDKVGQGLKLLKH